MNTNRGLGGVYVAALTPLNQSGELALEDMPRFLDFLTGRDAHGALLLGTTGEGPSFAPDERLALWQAAIDWRQSQKDFRLLAGTGTPSLKGTIQLTRAAFDLGMDGVVVLPPYYFRQVSESGLFDWFSQLIEESVPTGGSLFGYHIPSVSGVPLSIDLLSRLKASYPDRFAGIKDSSSDADHAKKLGSHFGDDLLVFNGNDGLFSLALENHAIGCITAMANLCTPDLRRVWDAHQKGQKEEGAQKRLEAWRDIFVTYPPAAPLLKALLPALHGLQHWTVRPPLQPISADWEAQAIQAALAIEQAGAA